MPHRIGYAAAYPIRPYREPLVTQTKFTPEHPEQAAAPAADTVDRFILTIFPMGHFANDWPGSGIYILAPAIALSMDLTPTQVGLLFTLHSAGASLAFLPAGLIADSIRKRGMLLAMTFWWIAIGYLAASMAPNFWTLVALLCLADLADSAWHPIATGAMVEQMPNRRAKALGIHALGGTLAAVGAPLVAGFLLAFLDWRTVIQVSILPTVIMGIVFLKNAHRIPRRRGHRLNRADLKSIGLLWLTLQGMRILAVVVLYNMAMMAILSMLPLFMHNAHGFTTAQTGMLFAAFWLLSSVLQPLLGSLSDRIGRKRVITWTLFPAAALIAMFTTISSPLLLTTTVILGAGILGGVRAVLLASMVDVSGKHESTTLGFAFSVMDGVGALGAVLAGMLGTIDLTYAFFFSAIAALGAVGLSLTNRRARHGTGTT